MADENESAKVLTDLEISNFLDKSIEKLVHLTKDDGNGDRGIFAAVAGLISARAHHKVYEAIRDADKD